MGNGRAETIKAMAARGLFGTCVMQTHLNWEKRADDGKLSLSFQSKFLLLCCGSAFTEVLVLIVKTKLGFPEIKRFQVRTDPVVGLLLTD